MNSVEKVTMKSAICTLYEGHYHFGVAALSNSLYNKGYRGTIYVGYRGTLPDWALKAEKRVLETYEAVILLPSDGLEICFIKLSTNYSLTNYKPDFMIELWNGLAKDADALYYFDPDIVVNQPWPYFEEWVQCGIALCEDVNSPIPEFHPRRVGWRNYYKKYNTLLTFKNDIYVNGGFVGLTKNNMVFLSLWKQLQENMGEVIGGLENSIFSKTSIPRFKGFQIFDKSDQDALNATVEAFQGDISFAGLEAMAFRHGENLMIHALGTPKPWKTNLISRALKGKPPRFVDSCYWEHTESPILAHTKGSIKRQRKALIIAKFLSRFYKV